jgi:hypothetical protein
LINFTTCTAQSKKITDHSEECFDSGEASGQGSLLMMMAMFFMIQMIMIMNGFHDFITTDVSP